MIDIPSTVLDVTKSKKIVSTKLVQTLWSGYGQITRHVLEGGNYDSVIVKHIQLPDDQSNKHPKGWNTTISHQRKLKSYQVESNWYSDLAKKADASCRIPKLLHCCNQDGEMFIIMEDLNATGFHIRKTSASIKETKACLKWLANFHGKYFSHEPDNLWETGTYWHVGTRADELEAMNDIELKNVAHKIDQRLNSCKYKTIVHGDAKLANFCFAATGEVAAVDFQYVGGGCGMKDVAYLLSSCLEASEIEHCESGLLKYYFDQLEVALISNNKGAHNLVDLQLVKKEWDELYQYAWADFHRFLDGWSPGHWKMNGHSKKMTSTVINELNGL